MSRRDVKRLAAALAAIESGRNALDRLDAARRLRRAAENFEQVCALDAHDDGYSWTEIGELLGLTRQGAQQRFSRDDVGAPRKPKRRRPKRSK